MIGLHASRPYPIDAYDPALSAFQSAKQGLVANADGLERPGALRRGRH